MQGLPGNSRGQGKIWTAPEEKVGTSPQENRKKDRKGGGNRKEGATLGLRRQDKIRDWKA